MLKRWDATRTGENVCPAARTASGPSRPTNSIGAAAAGESPADRKRSAHMQVVLVMFRAEGDRRSFSITRDVTVIGRREDCDLRIPVSEVSRKHCRVIKDGDTIRVEDLGSSNGTYHNGQRITGSVTLEPGDSVQVGPVVFVLQIDGNPPEDELVPFEQRAAQHLDDSVAPSPQEPAGDAEEASENLEILEDAT